MNYKKIPLIFSDRFALPVDSLSFEISNTPFNSNAIASAEQDNEGMIAIIPFPFKGTSLSDHINTTDYIILAKQASIVRKPKNEGYLIELSHCHRAKVNSFKFTDETYWVNTTIKDVEMTKETIELDVKREVLIKKIEELYDNTVSTEYRKLLNEYLNGADLSSILSLYRMCNLLFVANEDALDEIYKLDTDQEIIDYMTTEISNTLLMGELEENLEQKLKEEFEKSQKNYMLREKIKVFQKEIGEVDVKDEFAQKIIAQLDEQEFPAEVDKRIREEIERYKIIPSQAADSNVIRNYIEWVMSIPWAKVKAEKIDVKAVKKQLDADHYGLEDIKQRILEFLSVRKLTSQNSGSILCLVGPPGTGKSTLAHSIAKALDKQFLRISLGGVRDESEIRGHRRTYVGANPGRIIQQMKKSEFLNPLMLLDEIEKMGFDQKGDPSAALLEVLDPEQNNEFSDNFIEMPYDLSKVFFIATANDISLIPAPLMDRMEVIELGSYTETEKFNIAKRHIINKALTATGMQGNVTISDTAIMEIIRSYTFEAGVRNLAKEIRKAFDKAAYEYLNNGKKSISISIRNLEDYLGEKKYIFNKKANDEVGVVNGLSVSGALGGEVLPLESIIVPGTGRLILTGRLGDTMKESAQIAYTYIRSIAKEMKIDEKYFKEFDIHIHALSGAIPKDGPSAGITIALSLLSTLTNRKVRADFAMTGEISLRGQVLPIGGLAQKCEGAIRGQVNHVIFPIENERDYKKVANEVKSQLTTYAVKDFKEVIKLALI